MSELYHFGIKGQKWGVRRYQNADGSLTEEGRARYGKTNGKEKFAKDLFNDLNRTPFGKNYNSEIDKKIAAWGKTAEEAKMMSVKDPLSYFDLSRSRDQTRILSDVYDHMPSVMKKRKERADEIKKDADGFLKEKIDKMDYVFQDDYPKFQKAFGTKNKEDTRRYLIDAIKGYNESDPDRVIEQHMEDVPYLYVDGYLDKKTYNKMYDAQAADDLPDWVGWGRTTDQIKQYHDIREKNGPNPLTHSSFNSGYLAHYGTKGQKKGVRKYQNPDGTWTPLGLERRRSGVAAYGHPKKKDTAGQTSGSKKPKSKKKDDIVTSTIDEIDADMSESFHNAIKDAKKFVSKINKNEKISNIRSRLGV